MPYTPAGVVSFGFPIDSHTFTYLISGLADETAVAAAAGRAVAQDKTAANTVKLAGDGDDVFGRVFLAENRTVLGIKTAAIQRRFKEKLPAASGHGIAVGDRVIGAGAGLVKKNTAATPTGPVVVETGADFVVAEFL
ncbi:MAG: hypothetical protein ABW128_22750 [Rhizorhabdus sp.]